MESEPGSWQHEKQQSGIDCAVGRSPETSLALNAVLQLGKCSVVEEGLLDHALVVREAGIDGADNHTRLFQISQNLHVIALSVAHSSTSNTSRQIRGVIVCAKEMQGVGLGLNPGSRFLFH